MYIETKKRSVVKTISWRVWATLSTMALVFLFVGEYKVALTIGGLEVIVKIALYFFHERAWNKINYGKREIKPLVLWMTGLSGAGKSTIADGVYKELKKRNFKVEHLDGDSVRKIFPKTGFTKEDRNMHIRRVGYLASKLEENGVFVIASFISPYAESREFVRGLCQNFNEVFISTSLEVCEKRDVKGLYKKARSGEIKNFTGLDDPYEKPTSPDCEVNTDSMNKQEAINEVIKFIEKKI